MTAQPHNHFVFCVVVVEFAVNGNWASEPKISKCSLILDFPIFRYVPEQVSDVTLSEKYWIISVIASQFTNTEVHKIACIMKTNKDNPNM